MAEPRSAEECAAPEAYRFAASGPIPNSPLPLLVYRSVLGAAALSAEAFDALFARNGWRNGWHDGIYGYAHFHTTAHEVVGIARGRVRVRFGGEGGASLELAAGDAVAIPAGVAHQRQSEAGDLLVVGAYAEGRDYDMHRGAPGAERAVAANLRALPLPESDPVYGRDGPLMGEWRTAAAGAP
jgi:uncharacterized protein YjlB